MSLERRLEEGLRALSLDLSAAQVAALMEHLRLIAKWNRVYNLTAVRDVDGMLTHHLLDCLAAVAPLGRHLQGLRQDASASVPAAPSAPCVVLDVGAGAGLPGVTFAITLPTWCAAQVWCIDAVAKKAAFIRQVGAELGLSSLTAVHGRIEAVSLPKAQVITSRAFSSLPDLVQWTEQHLAPDGVWLALKGHLPTEEMQALPAHVEVFHVEPLQVPQLDAQRCLVWMRRRPRSPAA